MNSQLTSNEEIDNLRVLLGLRNMPRTNNFALTRFRNIRIITSPEQVPTYGLKEIGNDLVIENHEEFINTIFNKHTYFDNNFTNPTKYKILQENKFNFECLICYEKYKLDDMIYVLECGHNFCCRCLDDWIKSKNVYKPNFFCGGCNLNYQVDLEHIDYSLYCCPYCKQCIKNNTIFNTCVNSMIVNDDFLFELIKNYICKPKPFKSTNYKQMYKNFSKEIIIKLILLEKIIEKNGLLNPNKNIYDYIK
jgi:hypothetical protein